VASVTIDFPCTHPDDWLCKPSPDDPTRCVGQAKYEAWIVAEDEMAKARANGKTVYINTEREPNIVGNVDMTANDRKQPLGPTGKSEVIPLPDELQHLNDDLPPNADAFNEWRQREVPSTRDDG
jgi:hypothetical protein